jgi:hypothetical protein
MAKQMDTIEYAEPVADLDRHNQSADESAAIFVDEFESVQPSRDKGSTFGAGGTDALGRPRSVRKPR